MTFAHWGTDYVVLGLGHHDDRFQNTVVNSVGESTTRIGSNVVLSHGKVEETNKLSAGLLVIVV